MFIKCSFPIIAQTQFFAFVYLLAPFSLFWLFSFRVLHQTGFLIRLYREMLSYHPLYRHYRVLFRYGKVGDKGKWATGECLTNPSPVCGLRWFRWYFMIGLHPLQATMQGICVLRGSGFSCQHLHIPNAHAQLIYCGYILRVYTLKKILNCHTWKILTSETIN